MAFHNKRFPSEISFGAISLIERRSESVEMRNGRTQLNFPWRHSRRRFEISTGVKEINLIRDVVSFFEAREGRKHSFLFKDWSDFSSQHIVDGVEKDQIFIGYGDGETSNFQIVKHYGDSEHSYTRAITKPVENTVAVYCDNEVISQKNQDVTVDYLTGKLLFSTPPETGIPITASYQFDNHVRFDMDEIAIQLHHHDAGEIAGIFLMEIFNQDD